MNHPNPPQPIPIHPQATFNSNNCHLAQPTGNSASSDGPQLSDSLGGICSCWPAEIMRWWHDRNWWLRWEVPAFPGTGLQPSVISCALIKTRRALVVTLWGATKPTGLPDTRAQVRLWTCEKLGLGRAEATLSLLGNTLIPPRVLPGNNSSFPCSCPIFLSNVTLNNSSRDSLYDNKALYLTEWALWTYPHNFQSTNLHNCRNVMFWAQTTVAFVYVTSRKIGLGHVRTLLL